jgi:hypothetical protein
VLLRLQAKVFRLLPDDFLGRPSEQVLTVAVHESELPVAIEREDRYIDLCHDCMQQRRRFLSSKPLGPERVRERVDLHHHGAEGVVGVRVPGPDREVAFAKGCKEVRDGLQGTDEAVAEHHRQPGAAGDSQARDCAAKQERVWAQPEQNTGREHARQADRQRHQEDAAIVIDHCRP